MSVPLNLREIEKKAFRSTYEDGLLDVCIGGLIASFAVLSDLPEEDPARWINFGFFVGGLLVSELVFWLGKKFITVPRLGTAVFGPARKKRTKILAVILSGIVALQVLIVLGTVLLLNNPQWAASLGISASTDMERLLVASVGALFVGPSMGVIAYFSDFPRGFYIAVVLAAAVFGYIWFHSQLFMFAAAAVILVPGVVLFIRFLRTHPMPPEEVSHDG